MQLWGGTEAYLLAHLQVLQNKAARAVTGKSWYTPTRQLLKECNWLNVKQLIFYQSVLQVHKVLLSGKPDSIRRKFITDHPFSTRQATSGGLRFGQGYGASSELRHKSFLYRGTQGYNRIPGHIRKMKNMNAFKNKLKQWVKTNIPWDQFLLDDNYLFILSSPTLLLT